MSRLVLLLALAFIVGFAMRRKGWQVHRDCVPHDHVERNLRRWERGQARALASIPLSWRADWEDPAMDAYDEPGGGFDR